MKLSSSIAIALVIAAAGAQAQPATNAEHEAHHPAGTASEKAAPVDAAPSSGKAPAADTDAAMTRMDSHIAAMREMHEKMMAAKTPEARRALMADHMKGMQQGMAMMNEMSSGGMAAMPSDPNARDKMMEKRMDMMQTMMQMMMDRLPSMPAN